ncbi:Rha family transcriptional regulator [Pluralibacter gergoviae]|uniref:Rha family transcriptional regulator n=1 Tax=Pluralibacter gergoviae TaxID=61647 RepID=UPI00290C5CFA|nr:Rha family transcriptional regulator [Pluralibacter gergoviae]MDU4001451.1 Rha family transcriptional regulator [Pluralibacter gergoviae]
MLTGNLAVKASPVTMSSLDISELVKSRHTDVRRSIERLMQKGVITSAPMAFLENINSLGKVVKVKVYLLDKRDSYVVVAQLSPEFTGALVDRWQELESMSLSPLLPSNYKEALLALVVAEEEKEKLCLERDRAIETKAWIGDKKVATSMATASVAVRQRNALAEKLGECKKHATIKAVQRATSESFSYWPMKKWCAANGNLPKDVPDETYGTVKSWPREAWLAVHGVDLRKLF